MKKIIIYGAGQNYIAFSVWLKEHYEIVGLTDSDSSKWYKKSEGIQIVPWSIIQKQEYDFIVVTPNHGEAIIDMLQREYGLPAHNICTLENLVYDDKRKGCLSVCFVLVGGLGDAIINYNYIYCFYDKYKSVNLKVYIANAPSVMKLFAGENDFVCGYADKDIDKDDYDIVFELRRYPRVIRAAAFKIANISEKLLDYLLLCRKFEYKNPDLIHFGPIYFFAKLKNQLAVLVMVRFL